MKKTIIILLLLVSFGGLAQNPFKGFFKPVELPKKTLAKDISLIDKEWKFRPAIALEAIAINLNGDSQSLSTAGLGLSYSKYIEYDGNPYCKLSFNALLLTSIKLNNEYVTKFGGAVTVDVFNKLIGGGIGFIDNKFLILTTIGISL